MRTAPGTRAFNANAPHSPQAFPSAKCGFGQIASEGTERASGPPVTYPLGPAPLPPKTSPSSIPFRPTGPRLHYTPNVEDFATTAESPPRRLNRCAGSDDPTFPRSTTRTAPQIAPCFARHNFCSPPRTCFVFGCSTSSIVRRGGLAASVLDERGVKIE